MFAGFSKALTEVFRGFAGRALTERNTAEASERMLTALIEADVHVELARRLVANVRARAKGAERIIQVTPEQQFAKIVHDEIALLLGAKADELAKPARAGALHRPPLDTSGHPAVWLLCGLQGSGKTTACAKLAHYAQDQLKKRALLVACDLQRPMAVEQLRILAAGAKADFFSLEASTDPITSARRALEFARRSGHQIAILDTAGRMEVDVGLMKQLGEIKRAVDPREILFVASAAMGQSIAKVAREFHQQLNLTGAVLTMLDGDARAGAVLSIRAETGCPIKFEGIGERIEDLQPFHPLSMADRLLGMGDAINLVRRTQQHIGEVETRKLEEKLTTAQFTYSDFLEQMTRLKRMGPIANLLKMLPGMAQMEISDGALGNMEAMILSMTPQERHERAELTIARRRRVARGSGTAVEDVHKLVKRFQLAKQFFKNMPTNFKQLQKMMGRTLWR